MNRPRGIYGDYREEPQNGPDLLRQAEAAKLDEGSRDRALASDRPQEGLMVPVPTSSLGWLGLFANTRVRFALWIVIVLVFVVGTLVNVAGVVGLLGEVVAPR